MKNRLIIVESPSKIKTLKKFLDSKYAVEASVGHIRDLPKSNLGIDVEKDFSAEYTVSPNSVKTVKSLKAALKKADELLIATDPDREGEAIAWHIVDELKPKMPVKRLVFNEITKTAILEALEKTRDIDTHLVDSQETRRFLDRLFGFMVSKTMWTNMKGGVSAGRVQSPAVKILVDREKERSQFKQNEYWSISGDFENKNGIINAQLIKINGTDSSIAPLLPPLKPNHPNQSIKVPRTAKGKLEPVNLPLLASEYFPIRGPRIKTADSAIHPPTE